MLRVSLLLIPLVASPALAGVAVVLPEIGLVDNGDGTITLRVMADAGGSTAVELDVVFSGGLSIDGVGSLSGGADVEIADPIFDVDNPGNNPFTGDVTYGIAPDYPNDRLFVSYGSGIFPTTGPFDLLVIDYDGLYGSVTAGGNADLVAQFGVNYTVAPVTLDFSPLLGDADFDGDVDGDDLITVQTNFLSTGSPPLLGDADYDGDVDGDDLIAVQTNFLATAGDAVPEPSALVVLLGAAACFAGVRR